KSTGPRTPEGLERSRRANWKHGYYSREAKAERSRVRAAILALRYLRMLGQSGVIDARPHSIQNNSGLPQGLASPSVAGWACGRMTGGAPAGADASPTGEEVPHVQHEATRVHHVARRRGGVAARGARAAGRADAADRGADAPRG